MNSKRRKEICDKSEDSTWGLMHVKPITYLYATLAADWSTIKVGESLQNNLIEMFIFTAHSLKFSALRLVAHSGGGGELILEASRWHFARNAQKLCRLDYNLLLSCSSWK